MSLGKTIGALALGFSTVGADTAPQDSIASPYLKQHARSIAFQHFKSDPDMRGYDLKEATHIARLRALADLKSSKDSVLAHDINQVFDFCYRQPATDTATGSLEKFDKLTECLVRAVIP